jgi:EAL domain-containing protein (putative c-di-GMP-specific phosphodiesterase class I)/GGDEF domain-containing protein
MNNGGVTIVENLEFTHVLQEYQCVSVSIEVKKNLPVTVGREYQVGKKPITANLVDLVNAEDLTVLLARIDELSMSGSGSLRMNCRFVPDNKRYLICCHMRRERRFGKAADYLYGSVMDVHEFYKNMNSDPAEQELLKKELDKFSKSAEVGIVEIIGKELLCKMQIPLSGNAGLHSAIFTEAGKFICSADPAKTTFSVDEYKCSVRLYIKVNHVIYANWIIASDDSALIERYTPIHAVLVESLSKIANCYVMLYNEMVNTEHANKLLSETIEQQMLLNGIYSKLLNERNSISTMQAVVNLTGDFLKLDRIIICEDIPDACKYKQIYEWDSTQEKERVDVANLTEFSYADYPKLIEELSLYETYYSNNPEHDVLGLEFSSYVASNLNGDGSKYGIIIYVINDSERVLSHAEKRLLRSVSQIIAAVIMRCRDNEVLDETNKRLHSLAFRDQVLGVKNKASLVVDISTALEKGQSGAVVAFKFINIKSINNFMGDGSDVLVKEVLESISSCETTSAESYRFSDEVFMVLLRNADSNMIKNFCDELIERFEKPWQYNNAEYHLEITAGIAMYPETGLTAEEICRVAIMSQRKASEYGVNQYAFFSGDFEHPEIDGYQCAKTLRNAVENNMEGLTVKFSPVYSADKRLVSCEAQIALDTEESRDYPSHIIMKTAEKMGVDVTVNSWVIKKACEFCKKVQQSERFEHLKTVSVSATARTLTANTIVPMVKKAIEETGLPANSLAVQFTERVVAVNYDRFITVLSELKKLKVQVILDDVGSHYTATSLLRHSGISAAKADVTIFTGIIDDFSEVYINNMIKLAKDHNVNIGVKSIESKTQVERLQDVDWYQGSAYCAPLKEDEFFARSVSVDEDSKAAVL